MSISDSAAGLKYITCWGAVVSITEGSCGYSYG
jgi:hypothetical protein